jgi:ATP-dependent exoDNAse (exonuclease V) alpha subunit
MAIYHCSIKIISRSSGRSSVAAAAYRSAEKLHDHRTGLDFDFTKKNGVEHSEILLPDHAPAEYADRQNLWNAVEQVEKQKNAQTAREIEIALPAELPRAEQIKLARQFVQEQFVSRGMCADICVHDKRDDNPHAHILLTTRPINPDGSWGAKSQKEYIFDRNGQKIRLPSGEFKSRKTSSTDWDSRENAERWREAWAQSLNRELQRRGLELVDHRSFERQGIDREPTQHMGKTASELERQGIPTERGEHNRAVAERNARRERGRHIRNLDERLTSKREQDPTPTFEEWQRGQEPQKEQSRGLERGR